MVAKVINGLGFKCWLKLQNELESTSELGSH